MAKDKKRNNYQPHSSDAVYGLGLVGAVVFFMQQSHSFVDVVLGLLKSVVWPAYLVYKLFELVYS